MRVEYAKHPQGCLCQTKKGEKMIEITKTQSFLCNWNDGEKVEVHTRKSLEEHYGSNN